MNVKSAFLNGELEEEVYVTQPPGFKVVGEEHKVLKLKKALYGLKQAPRAWNNKIDGFLVQQGFVKCAVEYGIYSRIENGEVLIICLYVDDLLITGSNIKMIEEFKRRMKVQFEMTDLGRLSYFIGMEFTYSKKGILLHQSKYAKDVLKKFRMSECNAATTPIEANLKLDKDADGKSVNATLYRQMVGCLRYLCCSRPDICFSVGLLSRFMENPKVSHFAAGRRVLSYIKGTVDYGILLPNATHQYGGELVGYSDSDWAGDKDECRSTTGYIFLLGKSPISWCSKLQPVVALSSCEAEYISAAYTACQALWLESLVNQILSRPERTITLKIDNKSAISLAKNPIHHGRSKHIETRFHFIREKVREKKLQLEHCGTKEQLADIMTKPLNTRKFIEFRKRLNVKSVAELGSCVS
uniref:Retrovirus-related Pol polyprotein from transposon TNT 1-94 n=1 Tax=Cajanus cajan TaxID=3821 RepID=A0A151RW28_CAJCA|nr:Retrovirus-related Pol polyprotein from transposon TNT 1-94 [Cajanus cajan]